MKKWKTCVIKIIKYRKSFTKNAYYSYVTRNKIILNFNMQKQKQKTYFLYSTEENFLNNYKIL